MSERIFETINARVTCTHPPRSGKSREEKKEQLEELQIWQEHIEHHLTSGDASGNTTGPQDELRTSTGRRPMGEERDGVQTETVSKLMKSQRNLARQIELLDQKVNLPPSSLLLPGAKVSAPSPVQVLLRDWLLPPHPLTG